MANFKDFITQDINIFINSEEFAETHNINGRTLTIIMDTDKLQERSKKEYDGLYIGDLLFFVKAQEYGKAPKPDSIIQFDGKPCVVFDVRHDVGMYEIILKLNAS